MPARSASASSLPRPPARRSGRLLSPDTQLTARKTGFAVIAAGVDLCGIATAATAAGALAPYDKSLTSNTSPMAHLTAPVGMFALLLVAVFVTITFFKRQYGPAYYLSFSDQASRSLATFTLAFYVTTIIGVMAGSTSELSWAHAGAFLAMAFPAVLVGRFILVPRVRANAARAGITPRRTILIGTEEEIAAFYGQCQPEEARMCIVSAVVLREPNTLADDLALAAATARILRADDIFILVPWADTETVKRCLDAFLCVPAFVHLGPGSLRDHLAQARIAKTGPFASLTLDRSTLYGPNVLVKRTFDIVVSFAALAVLAPVFLALAIAIALDSKGPVLFRQRRYGFNQEPFRIFKFRSMRTFEDERDVKQASAGDPRITRVGRFMRRTNLDELPQLVNVLFGDMSLVGPRPHALSHDQLFKSSVSLYGRRHNVKPGITGWAQVNGLRGEVTPETLKARIEHDLYYIDNWSLWLDLWILWRTLTSRKASQNAY